MVKRANRASPAAAVPRPPTGTVPARQDRVGSINELHHLLGSAARRGGGPSLSAADLDDAVHAAVELSADPARGRDARALAEQLGWATAHMARLALPADARRTGRASAW